MKDTRKTGAESHLMLHETPGGQVKEGISVIRKAKVFGF